MKVYHVKSNNCKVEDVRESNHRVIVACDNVDNRCRPVHYEKYKNQTPDNIACI